MDDSTRGGSRPLWYCRNLVAESGVVDFVDEDTDESDSLFVRVRLGLGVDLDDECGSHWERHRSVSHVSISICTRKA